MAVPSIAGSNVNLSFGSPSTQQKSSDAAAATSVTTTSVTTTFKRDSDRVEQQLNVTKVQLSAYGQIKSAVAEVQTTSRTLSDPEKTGNAADIRKAVGSFVSAYNKAVASATRSDDNDAGAVANDVRVRFAGAELSRSVDAGNNRAELQKIGVTQNTDGSLSVDAKALDTALHANPDQVRSTIGAVGQAVEKTAARELAGSGNTGSSTGSPDNRGRNREAQRNTQQEQMAAAQRLVEQQTTQPNSIAAGGLAAYQRTFSG